MGAASSLENYGLTLEVGGDGLTVTPASLLTDEIRAFIRSNKTRIIDEIRARQLPISPTAADIPTANDGIPVALWTPRGHSMVVLAQDEAHAKQMREWNPKPTPTPKPEAPHTVVTGPLPKIPNPGIPMDLYRLALRYSLDAMGDTEEEALVFLFDLKVSEPNFWRDYLRERLGIPEIIKCSGCHHSEDTGGNLGRCGRGLLTPGGSGLWWLDSDHSCELFTSASLSGETNEI